MLLQMMSFHSFLRLSSIPLYICTISLSIHQWTFRLFPCLSYCEIVLQWTQGCIYLFEWKFCPDKCPGVGLLDHMVVLYLVFWGASISLSIVVLPIYIPTNNVGEVPFLHILSSICYLYLLTMAILTGVCSWVLNFFLLSCISTLCLLTLKRTLKIIL